MFAKGPWVRGRRFLSLCVVARLTDQDLKEIGVSLGHRRLLQREIANLDTAAPAPLYGLSPTAPRWPTRPWHRSQKLPPSAAVQWLPSLLRLDCRAVFSSSGSGLIRGAMRPFHDSGKESEQTRARVAQKGEPGPPRRQRRTVLRRCISRGRSNPDRSFGCVVNRGLTRHG